MRVAILLPFLAAAQCLELAVIFCVLYLKVSRRLENLAFSLLAFFLGGMIGCELLLQEADSLPRGLFWYRLQLFFALFSSALMVHFLSIIVGRPLARRVWLGLLYPFTALMAAGTWHPLVLHLPPPHTLPGDIDTSAPGPLFYPYVGLPLAGLILASSLGLNRLKRYRTQEVEKQEVSEAAFRPLFRYAAWIVTGVLLIILASAVEVLELVLPPSFEEAVTINPRAIAISLFCLTTAWVLGQEFLLTEKREQQLAADNRLLDALMQFRLQTARDIQHEIGNKLIGISTPLKVALLGLEQGRSPRHLAERLTDALTETQALESLIQIMLNNARMEAGQTPRLELPEPTDVEALIQSLCAKKSLLLAQEREAHLLRGGSDDALPRHRFHLTASLAHARAPAHAATLTRLLDNLLDNAVKYTPRGGDIHLHLQEQNGELAITVSDPGLGIAPEDQARIFDEPFHRGRTAAASAVTGTGLGLNLVKRLLEAQGGRITVRSMPDEGSAFTLTLPWMPDNFEA